MSQPTVDQLINEEDEQVKDTLRPNIQLDDKLWYDFTYALEYLNLNRATKLHTSAVMEGFLGEFVVKVRNTMLKKEGSVNGFEMYMADKRLEKKLAEEKRRASVKEAVTSKLKKDSSTLLYSRKTVVNPNEE